MKKILSIIFSFLFFSSVLAQTDSYIRDTAYIDPMKHYNNQADSVDVKGHVFKGPGPFTVHFKAEMNERPQYCAWELAEDNKFQQLIDRFRAIEADGLTSLFDYEFSEQGSYYVRFTADFLDLNGDTIPYNTPNAYEITISTSILEIPNLLTPDSPSNNVFKVKYQSLVKYEIWIYNRWGQELFHSTDPSEGWDGKHNGSTVPTGVYYYVVKAQGTDNQKYVKKGDINVLKTRSNR